MLTKMREDKTGVHITARKQFIRNASLQTSVVETCINFAYNMTFGKSGAHRSYRTGGSHIRKLGEIFANTFQGKLSEFALYTVLQKDFSELKTPDLETYELGKWDDSDFKLKDVNISVKSTKSFGNLLLLESKDWNEEGKYIPNIDLGCAHYAYFILIRIEPFCEDIMKRNRLLYSDVIELELLKELLLSENWYYDCPGFITDVHLQYAIKNSFIIKQNAMLNGRTKMDAENYYIQAGDFINISELYATINK